MLDIIASEVLQAKKLWKNIGFGLQEGLWNPTPENKNVSLYALSQSAQECNYNSHFTFFFLKIICHFRNRDGGRFFIQCEFSEFRNPFKSHRCVWNKVSSHMASNHSILPNLPFKQAKDNTASQLACRKTIVSTAWKASKYHLYMSLFYKKYCDIIQKRKLWITSYQEIIKDYNNGC